MDRPLMPKATAVWLVENTSLTFEQIAEFCNLHPLEVKGIADGEVGAGIRGWDPVASGQLERCSNSPLLAVPACASEPVGALAGGCGPCGATQSVSTTWGRLKVQYR